MKLMCAKSKQQLYDIDFFLIDLNDERRTYFKAQQFSSRCTS